MKIITSIIITSIMLLSCKLKWKEYITVYLPSDFCGDIYIVPDKNSEATSNEIHLDSTGVYLMNYDAAASFNGYEMRIIQNGKDISDSCKYYESSVSTTKGEGHVDYEKIKVPCKNEFQEIKNKRNFTELIYEGKNIRQ